MAGPFQIPLTFLSAMSSMFTLFILIVVFEITMLTSRGIKEEKNILTLSNDYRFF